MQDRVSVVDLGVMCDRAYGRKDEDIPKGWREDPAQIYETGLLEYDYSITAFINDDKKLIVLANRGSIPLANFVNDDLKILQGKIFGAYRFSLDTSSMYSQKYKNYQLIHTGHSLGAASAALVALVRGERAIAFDSPGIQIIINNTPDIKNTLKKEAAITLYQSIPNVVNQCGEHYQSAEIIQIKLTDEINAKLSGKNIIDSTFETHSLKNILSAIKKFSCQQHTIKSGDTLSSIAKNYYGITKEWQRIYNDNKTVIGNNPDKISPGKTIIIHQATPKFI